MENKFLRRSIVLSVVLMVVCAGVMIGKYSSKQSDFTSDSHLLLEKMDANYSMFMQEKMDTLTDLSQKKDILNYFKEVQQVDQIKSNSLYDTVENHVKETVYRDEQITYAYIASNHVNSFLSEPPFQVEGYVPSERNWFIDALETDGISMSLFYRDAFTGSRLISMSRVIKDQEVHGVAGIDVLMDPIEEIFKSNGKTMVVIDEQLYPFFDHYKEEPTFVDGSHMEYNIYIFDDANRSKLDKDQTFIQNDVRYIPKTNEVTGHKILIVDDIVLENKLIVSSLLQTLAVFIVVCIICLVMGVTIDSRLRKKQFNQGV